MDSYSLRREPLWPHSLLVATSSRDREPRGVSVAAATVFRTVCDQRVTSVLEMSGLPRDVVMVAAQELA